MEERPFRSTEISAADAPDPATGFEEELTSLRGDSLRLLGIFVILVGYVWFNWIAWPETGGQTPGWPPWLGSLALAGAGALALILRQRALYVASIVLITGAAIAALCAALWLPGRDLVYLLILPIAFAGALLGEQGLLISAGLALLTTLTLDLALANLTDWRALATPLLHLAVMLLVSLALWLSARTLYVAFIWFWRSYDQARQSEEAGRLQRGELRRALKALDEATHRLERTNYMLALARDQAEEARRLKQRFAQTISHELRTPLNLVVGFTELMTESPGHYGGPPAPAYLRDLNIVHRNASHLQSLVNDVLDLARIESAQMIILREKTDPVILTREAVDTARSLVEARGLSLRTHIEPNLPSLWIDPTRIRQVLFNLLNNAARFTERGSVTVRAWRDGDQVCFSVSDTGVGIPTAELPRIFEEFHQVDGTTRRRHSGAGLGLSISRQFVELHGGRIWAESTFGQGSTFTFTLPTGRQHEHVEPSPKQGRQSLPSAPQKARRPVVLTVTRSPSAATLLSRHVQEVRILTASSLVEAADLARSVVPQTLIVDTNIVDIDLNGLRALASEWGLLQVPLIACTLPGEEPLRQQLHVSGYLIKPVTREALWDVLRQQDGTVERVLIVDDDRDFVLLMSRLLEDDPLRSYRVIGAYNGREGLEMAQHHEPDLLLLDLGLPDLDGRQVIERLQRLPVTAKIPSVVVSGQDDLTPQATAQGFVAVTRTDGLPSHDLLACVRQIATSTFSEQREPPEIRSDRPR